VRYKDRHIELESEKKEYLLKSDLMKFLDDFLRHRTYLPEDYFTFGELKRAINKEMKHLTGKEINNGIYQEKKKKIEDIDAIEKYEKMEEERQEKEWQRKQELIRKNTIGTTIPLPKYEDVVSGKVSIEKAFPPINMEDLEGIKRSNGTKIYTIRAMDGVFINLEMAYKIGKSELMWEDRFEQMLDIELKKRRMFATPESAEYFKEIEAIKPTLDPTKHDSEQYYTELLFKKRKNRLARIFLLKGLQSNIEEIQEYRKKNPDSLLEYGNEMQYEFATPEERFNYYKNLEKISGSEMTAYPDFTTNLVHIGNGKYMMDCYKEVEFTRMPDELKDASIFEIHNWHREKYKSLLKNAGPELERLEKRYAENLEKLSKNPTTKTLVLDAKNDKTK
jgi:hypothetical protein